MSKLRNNVRDVDSSISISLHSELELSLRPRYRSISNETLLAICPIVLSDNVSISTTPSDEEQALTLVYVCIYIGQAKLCRVSS